MTFSELAAARFSERRFDARPVEDEKLAQILEAGRLAPTACNYQPQKIYLIKRPEAMEKAKSVCRYMYGCPAALLVCYDTDTVWTNPSDGYYVNYNSGEQDAAIVASTMMYEAEDIGVHTLWIRGFDSKELAEAFGLPENHRPVMMLALGYPGEDSHPAHLHAKRKPLEETVTVL